MDIGPDATQALSLLNPSSSSPSSSSSSDEHLQALAMASISVLLGTLTEEVALSQPSLDALPVDFIKRTYSALVCLFLQASSLDLSPSQLSSFLRLECRLLDPQIDLLCRSFQQHKAQLRGLLSRTSEHSYLPQLLKVDWRLDYCVSSSQDRAVREFLYHVCFNTFDPATGKEDPVKFVCNVEQLQDLVSQLEDACKSVERAVHSR